MKQSFLLSWRQLVRGHVLTLLLVITALIHLFFPSLVRGDGTASGWREMFIRAVPGATYAFISVTILASACGFFAQERERRRLALTVVRPVSLFAVAVGRWLALCAVAMIAIALTALLTGWRVSGAPSCQHHYAPTMPPAGEVAQAIMQDYLKHPETIQDLELRALVTNAPPSEILRVLTNREVDRYDVINSGQTVEWPFERTLAGFPEKTVRTRFATQLDLTSSFSGIFKLGEFGATISNKTQSILDVPLKRLPHVECVSTGDQPFVLQFENTWNRTVMLRPRRDLEILVEADSFNLNLLRASIQMISTLALLAAFGLFLSSALSRPVAIFTAIVTLLVILIAPSVVEQFPDTLDVRFVDRIGVWVSRIVTVITKAAGEAEPISKLATDACIEWTDLAWCTAMNILVLPAVLLGLSTIIIRRKPLADQTSGVSS